MTLACQYVDDVVIGAPYIITADLIKSLNISKVVYVRTEDDQVKEQFRDIDPYAVPKEMGIYVELPTVEDELTVLEIAERVHGNQEALNKKLSKKHSANELYYK